MSYKQEETQVGKEEGGGRAPRVEAWRKLSDKKVTAVPSTECDSRCIQKHHTSI